jgi:hypothetical protein
VDDHPDRTRTREGSAEEHELDMAGPGSTTVEDEGWERGVGPDACSSLRNAERVRGPRRIVPRVDPAPEIVFEAGISRSSIDGVALYAQFGVAGVWRHDGTSAEIHVLGDGAYRRTDAGAAVAGPDAATLTRLLADGLTTPLPRRLRQVREWARTA